MFQMNCNQCEQTAKEVACGGPVGVCGKNEDVESLQQTLLYGLKGMAAYAYHARRLGKTDPEVDEFVEKALFATVTNVDFDMDHLLGMVLECGTKNLRVMEMLDEGHVETFGKPEPTTVYEGTKAGPGILVTGHDMIDLKALLEQVEGTDVLVYTHGEMLPAHMYPELKKHANLAGHWGGAWQKQRREFEDFGGAILANTNCVMIPSSKSTYLERFFVTGPTGLPGTTRIENDDYSPLIEAAKKAGPLAERKVRESTIGFHRTVLLDNADKIVAAVKEGLIKHFFLIGGCDGAKPGRNYFSEYAAATPDDTIILTLGCGKYRIREHDYGEVAGFPRLLDMGQCNDAYGAIQIALALAKAFECGVNDLPLTIVLSWYEQKAVVVLLSLLSLGIKGISIGPSVPAFLSSNVLKILSETFDLRPIGSDPKADVAAAMA